MWAIKVLFYIIAGVICLIAGSMTYEIAAVHGQPQAETFLTIVIVIFLACLGFLVVELVRTMVRRLDER